MGPVAVFYIAFASISFFACFLQLFITYKKKGDLVFLICSFLSLIIFVYFSLKILLTTPFGSDYSPKDLFRYLLLISEVAAIGMLGVIYYLLKGFKRAFILINLLIAGLIFVITIFIPDESLFGDLEAVREVILPHGDYMYMLVNGWSLWRIFLDVNILVFVVSAYLLLFKRLEIFSFRISQAIFSGCALLFFAGVYDQLVDLGLIRSIYILPFALFVVYIVLIFVPFILFINRTIDLQNILNQEFKWRSLINEAQLIVVGLNRMGLVDYINPYFCELTGFKKEDVIGKDWFEFFIPSNEFYNVQGAFIEILEFDFNSHYLNPILTKDRKELMISWYNVRTQDQNGKITGSISIGIDITDDINERELLLAKLQEAERVLDSVKKKNGNIQNHSV